MSDTPRTDLIGGEDLQEEARELRGHAQRLERELAALRGALERIAALDDGDETYWWQGEPMEAIKHVRNTLARA